MDHAHGRLGLGHLRLGEGAKATADGVEDWLGQYRRQAFSEDRVDASLGLVLAFGQHRLDRQGAERHADRAFADPVVQYLRHLEAAAAHVADETDRAEQARNHALRGVVGLLRPGQHAHLQPRPRRRWP